MVLCIRQVQLCKISDGVLRTNGEPEEHPYGHRNFMEGHSSMKLAGENPFGRILVDQTMEVTVNKDTKTTGIVTIFSLKTGAVNRPYLTAEYGCAFLDQLRSLVQAKRLNFTKMRCNHRECLKIKSKCWQLKPSSRAGIIHS